MTQSIFSKIIARELPAEIVFENEAVIAFKDIHPVAPIHILICPKKPIKNFQEIEESDWPIILEVLKAAQLIAKQMNIAEGYRLITNNGQEAGQEVFHLHFHLIGGRKLGALA